jgi:ankyrin repeat protein
MRYLPFNPLQDMKDTLLTLTITSMLATTAFADPIHDAAKTGNLAGVQAELDKGVDANEADRSFYDLTPLHWAISKGVAELLISEGADVNAITLEGSTPLHFAAWNGRKEIAEILIDNGADLNVINNELAGTPFITALDWAIQQGKTETADLLRKHGGKTAQELNALIDAAKNGDIEVVKQHLAAGADVNMEAGDGTTPLHNAAIYGHKEVGEILIAEGADVNAKDDKGRTPLDLAIKENKTKTADLLRKHGGKTSEELNALIDAAKNGDIEVVKQHLAAGADVNAKIADGTTPLHNAAVYGHTEVAELLIANGANMNAIIVSGRNQGKTPLDLAIWRKKTETADLLRKHGGRTAEELALMPQLVYSKGPFDFSFTAKDGKTYVIEVTQDLKQWGELETIEGIGKQVKFIDPRQPLVPFKRNFYRVKLVE